MENDLRIELSGMLKRFGELEDRKNLLLEKSSTLDKKVCDIMHCAEFYELDACKGYKLYRILHETRIERRKVKNELEGIFGILRSVSVKNIESATKSFENAYRDKKYAPRVVDELFDLFKEGE